jgi:hypothetical protein
MKVVCIDTNFRMAGIREQLELGKVYEASFVFFNEDSGNGRTNWLPVEWESNYLNLEGFSEIDWFPTKNFVTQDIWRQKILNEILSTQKQLHVITTSEIREGKLNDLGI